MAKAHADQAEGLRRLFAGDSRRMIAVLSTDCSSGSEDVTAELAHALAAQGRSVLVLDEFLSAGELHKGFGVTPKHDLVTLMLAQAEMESAVMRVSPGVALLAGGANSASLPRPRMEAQVGMVNAFYRLAGRYDTVLVRAYPDAAARQSSYCWACQDVIVLCGQRQDDATQAYALIKMLHHADERGFHLLFQGMNVDRARALHHNLAAVSRRHLKLMPEYLGLLPSQREARKQCFDEMAETLQKWPVSYQKAGLFPELMRRLLRGARAPAIQAVSK